MIKRYTYKQLAWVNIESPTSEEIKSIMEEFDIHPAIAQELLLPTPKPRVELHKNLIYLILHFPVLKNNRHDRENQEIDFIIGKNFIITTSYDGIFSIQNFSKLFEVNSILDKGNIGDHAGYIFYYMIKEMYHSLADELDFTKDSLKEIENEIFNGKEKEMVVSLSKVSRDLLNFHHATSAHKQVLRSFESAALEFFSNDFSFYIKDLINEFYKINSMIESGIESLREMRETNNSLLTTKQNEVMKIFTIMAFITFPSMLLSSLMGMNTKWLPVGMTGDFWIIIGLIVISSSGFYLFFKYKKWI